MLPKKQTPTDCSVGVEMLCQHPMAVSVCDGDVVAHIERCGIESLYDEAHYFVIPTILVFKAGSEARRELLNDGVFEAKPALIIVKRDHHLVLKSDDELVFIQLHTTPLYHEMVLVLFHPQDLPVEHHGFDTGG
jgi:hypothetical protein